MGYNSQMKTASVSRLKNTLSARLKEVVAGESLLITDRQKPIAVITPLDSGNTDEHLASLIQRGIVAPASKPLDLSDFLRKQRGRCTPSLSSAVIEERENR